jgi:PAS domain S-box-containing protein
MGLILMCLLSPLHAQVSTFDETWRWVRFTTEHGLPADNVHSLVETPAGTVWAVTSAGIAWFDGYEWHPVGKDQGLPNGQPEHMGVGPGDDVLIVVDLQLFRGDRHGFTEVVARKDGERIEIYAAEMSAGGDLLVMAEDALYTCRNDTLQVVADLPAIYANPIDYHFKHLWKTQAGRLWLKTTKGLHELQDGQWHLRLEEGSAWRAFWLLSQAKDGSGLAATKAPIDESGLWQWDAGDVPKHGEEKRRGMIRALDIGPDGDAVVVYDAGTILLRRQGKWAPWIHRLPEVENIGLVKFRKNGDLWLGTEHGLLLHRHASSRWTDWADEVPSPMNIVYEIIHTETGDTWMSTLGGVKIRHRDGQVKEIDEILGTGVQNVTALAEDGDGNIWIGSGATFTGAFRWDGSQWRHFGERDGLTASNVHKIRRDRRGQPWFLGLGNLQHIPPTPDPGAFVYKDGKFERWGVEEGLLNGRVYAFAETRDGALWFGTWSGLSRWKEGNWTHWARGQGLRVDRVFALVADQQDQVWFAHIGGGLGYIDGADRVHYETITPDGPDPSFWDLRIDADGRLWASSLDGLFCYHAGGWSHLGIRTGLSNSRLWPLLPVDERIYVGTQGNGVCILDLTALVLPPPRVRLTATVTDEDKVLLAWKAFSWWGEQDQREIQTRYRLEGQAWSLWGTTRKLTLEGLGAGERTFEIQGRNLLGEVGPVGATISFGIPLPMYRQWPFVVPVGVLLLAVCALGAVMLARKRSSEEMLQQSEERYRDLFENASDIIYTHDEEGRLTSLNRAGLRLLGYESAPSPPLLIEQIIPPEHGQWLQGILQDTPNALPSPCELEFLDSTGTRVPVEVSVRRVQLRGELVEIQGIARDISERRAVERERAMLEERLLHSQKMEAIGQLTAGIAHNFNNMLMGIIPNLEMATIGAPEELKPLLADADQSAHRAADIVKQLLVFTRMQDVSTPEAVDLEPLVGRALDLCRKTFDRKIAIEEDIPGELPAIHGDESQLEQVLLNLCINARDALAAAAPEKPRLRLTASLVEVSADRGPLPPEASTGPHVRIEVSDNGTGMDAETKKRIFEPFFTTKEVGQGTGLGLAMVYGVVQQHQGWIVVESTPGRGTDFAFYLPLASADDRPEEDEEQREIEGIPGTGETILVVDDEEILRRNLRLGLEHWGYVVLAAADGAEAVEVFRRHQQEVDLVLLDLSMPHMSGREALAAMRQIDPAVKVIILTGFADPETNIAGVQAVIQKPVGTKKLLQLLRRSLGSHSRIPPLM